MTDTTTLSPNGKATVPSKAVGVSGTVLQGGVLIHQDQIRAWQGRERDTTIQAMMFDPLIGAVLHGVEMLCRRVDWHVKPADDSTAAEDAAGFVQECHPAGTLVRVAVAAGQGNAVGDALVPIETLRVGDRVVTHRGSVRRITETIQRDYSGDMVTLSRVASNVPLVATPNHPLFIRRHEKVRRRMDPKMGGVRAGLHYEWARASDVRVGDYLTEPIDCHIRDIESFDLAPYLNAYASARGQVWRGPDAVAVTPGFMRLVGYFLAEGGVLRHARMTGKDTGIAFTFHEDETAFHQDVTALLRSCFGVEAKVAPVSGQKAIRVTAYSAVLARFFAQFSHDGERWLPAWARQLPDEKTLQLLIGLLCGDAHFGRDQIVLTGRSNDFLDLIRRQFLRLGVVPAHRHCPGRGPTKPHGVLVLSGSHARRFCDLAGIEYGRDHRYRAWSQTFVSNGYAHYPVESIDQTPVEGLPVYNLEVVGDHSYLANGVASHNCLDDMTGHWPGDTLAAILTYLGWGWSCMEVVYKRREGPTGTPPSRHDDGKTGWHRWALRPQATRYGWEFDGDDPTALIQQDPATFKRITVPLAKCLLFRYASRDNSPEGSTPLRVAYDAWYNKRKLQRIEAIGIERDLAGLPVGRVPANDISTNSAVYQAMQTIVTNIRNDAQAGLVIAGDRDASGNYYQDVTLLATGGQRSFDTDPIIRRYANEVVTVFLANVMRTGQDSTGSYALAETQGGLFQQAIGAHLDTIAQTINEQAVLPLCRLNGIPDELVPTLEHGDIESADLARLGKYLTDLATAGMLVDTPELRSFLHQVAGIPVPTAKEMAEQQAKEEEEAAAAEKARVDALKAAQDAQGAQEGEDAENVTPMPQRTNGGAVAASEVVGAIRLIEDDGSVTLSDLLEVMTWFDSKVDPEFRGILNAKVIGSEE